MVVTRMVWCCIDCDWGFFPSFIKVQQHVLRWASSVLANVCVALLCWFSRRLFM